MEFSEIFIKKSVNQEVKLPELTKKGVQLFVKREDLLHPYISGNKLRKLKYNLLQARRQGYKTLLSFGGAYSNHIHALAYAGKLFGFETIGVIRGEELARQSLNPTLHQAKEWGMKFHFIHRTEYRNKEKQSFLDDLKQNWGDFYLIPEGGTNERAVKGCSEILSDEDEYFNYIALSAGTGGTASGVLNGLVDHQTLCIFPAIKNFVQLPEILKKYTINHNFLINNAYHFGGYAKINQELFNFVTDFKQRTQIPLDYIYTSKLIFGIINEVREDKFKSGDRILAIHTGGLQGNQSIEKNFLNK